MCSYYVGITALDVNIVNKNALTFYLKRTVIYMKNFCYFIFNSPNLCLKLNFILFSSLDFMKITLE